jgi:hypothetical protein
MSDWIKVEADRVRTEVRRKEDEAEKNRKHDTLVDETWPIFWGSLQETVTSNVAAWNAEFVDDSSRHLAVEGLDGATFRLLKPSANRIMNVSAGRMGILCDQHAKDATDDPRRRAVPVLRWAVDGTGVIGIESQKGPLAGPESVSEFLIRSMLS